MTSRKSKIAGIIIAPIIIGAIFFLCGSVYWHDHAHETATTCLYADKDCSLAVGTWVLADVTLAAFVAAAVAAFFAVNAYDLETRAVLGHKLCTLREHRSEPDVTLYVTSAVKKPTRFPPINKGLGYFTEHHAFLNLGRTPLTDVRVRYSIKVDGRSDPFTGPLGLDCIPVDGETHVTVYVRKELTGVKIAWQKQAKDGARDLAFFPGKAYSYAASSLPRKTRSSERSNPPSA